MQWSKSTILIIWNSVERNNKGAENVITQVKYLKIWRTWVNVLSYFPSLQNREEIDSVAESVFHCRSSIEDL